MGKEKVTPVLILAIAYCDLANQEIVGLPHYGMTDADELLLAEAQQKITAAKAKLKKIIAK